ncbi:hypothetical protein HKD37_05G012981 [Glycine soja]
MEVIYLSFMKKDSRTLGKAWKKNGNGLSFPLDQLVKKRKNEHEWVFFLFSPGFRLLVVCNMILRVPFNFNPPFLFVLLPPYLRCSLYCVQSCFHAELWVNNMSNADNVRTNVDLKGRPFGLGLGAKVSLQSKFVLSNDPVERKLHAKLNAEKRKNS